MVPPSDVNVGFINPMKTSVRYAINPIEFSHLFEHFGSRELVGPHPVGHTLLITGCDRPLMSSGVSLPDIPSGHDCYIAMENDGPNRNR